MDELKCALNNIVDLLSKFVVVVVTHLSSPPNFRPTERSSGEEGEKKSFGGAAAKNVSRHRLSLFV